LRRAGHTLLLYSARSNRASLDDPTLDPLVRAGVRKVHQAQWLAEKVLYEHLFQQMVDFVAKELPGVFDAIDDGRQGKPHVDMFIDDRATRFGQGTLGMGWAQIAASFGQPDYSAAPLPPAVHEGTSYQDFLAGMRVVASRVKVAALALTAVGPQLVVSTEGDPLLVIVAGQHGDEDAGPLGLCQYFGDIIDHAKLRGVGLRVYPCANPEGFEDRTHENRRGQARPNRFIEYEVGGLWKGEIHTGEAFTRQRRPPNMSHDSMAILRDLLGWSVYAVLDLHQDSLVPVGQAYAYAFGDPAPYVTALQSLGVAPMASRELRNEAWSSLKGSTDADGIVRDYHDGTLTDYLWRRGAKLSACFELSTRGIVPELAGQVRDLCRAMIDLTANRATAR
jgi:hypothetical protein